MNILIWLIGAFLSLMGGGSQLKPLDQPDPTPIVSPSPIVSSDPTPEPSPTPVFIPCDPSEACSGPTGPTNTFNDADCPSDSLYTYLAAATDGWPMGYMECTADLPSTVTSCIRFNHNGTWDYQTPAEDGTCETDFYPIQVDPDTQPGYEPPPSPTPTPEPSP